MRRLKFRHFLKDIKIWFTKTPFRSSHLYKYNNNNPNARYFCDFIILSDWKMSNYVRQKVLISFKMLNKQMYRFTKRKKKLHIYFYYSFSFNILMMWHNTLVWWKFSSGPSNNTRCAHITLHCTKISVKRAVSPLSHINHNYEICIILHSNCMILFICSWHKNETLIKCCLAHKKLKLFI